MTTEADAPPDEVVAAVADAIRAAYALPELSEEEREQRWLDNQIFREEQRQRDEQQRIEYERKQAEAAEQERREAAIAAAQARDKAHRERQERNERMSRERELSDLRYQTRRHEAWQHNVQTAARNAVAIQRWEALMADLERTINPPAAPPEPEIVYVEAEEGSDQLGDSDFNPKLWAKKPRRWFQ